MKETSIDQIVSGLGQTLKTLAEKSNQPVDLTAVIANIPEIVKNIPYGSVSGDQVSGGQIKNFSSSGIKDSATKPVLNVTNTGIETEAAKINLLNGNVTVEETLVAKNITVTKDLTVSGILRANVDVNYNDLIKRIPQRALSGDLITGGIIRNFASTGITDKATTAKIVINDDAVLVDTLEVKKLLGTVEADNFSVSGTLTANKIQVSELKADVRLERTSSLEFVASAENPIFGKGLLWTGVGGTKQLVLRQDNKIFSSESLEIARDRSFMIDSIAVLSGSELGPTVRKSRLTEVGNLKSLTVLGDVNFNNGLFYTEAAGRLGLGTETPNANLSVFENNVEVVVGVKDKVAGMIGTHGYQDFNIVTDNTSRILVSNNGNILLGNKNSAPVQVAVHGKLAIGVNSPDPAVDLHVSGPIKFNNQLQTHAAQPPAVGFYNKTDIVWNTEPRVGQPVGWVCTRSGMPGEWRPFGIIG